MTVLPIPWVFSTELVVFLISVGIARFVHDGDGGWYGLLLTAFKITGLLNLIAAVITLLCISVMLFVEY